MMKTQAVEPTSWSQYIENAPAIVITAHIFIYRALLCNRTCHDKKVHNRLFGVFFIKETKNIAQWS